MATDADPPGTSDPEYFPDDLRRVRDKLSKIEDEARDRVEEFLDLAEEAEQGRAFVDWYERAWPKLREEDREDLVSGLNGPSSAQSYLSRLDSAERSLNEGGEAARAAFADVGFVSSGMSTATGSAIGRARGHLEKDEDTLNLTFPQFDRGSKQRRIDRHLRNLDAEDLVEGRRGAWAAFQRDAPDANTQACHSMREVLTELLNRYAPRDEFQRAEWWEPDEEAPNGVTKRHKIRYFVAGKREVEIDAKELDRQVDRALDAHDNAVSVAHGEELDRESARAGLVALEEAIETLLAQREQHRMRRSLRPGARNFEFD